MEQTQKSSPGKNKQKTKVIPEHKRKTKLNLIPEMEEKKKNW